MKGRAMLFLILLFLPSAILPQTIVWEKVYDTIGIGAAFDNIIFSSSENSYFYGVGSRLYQDTNSLVVAKFDNDGNLIFAKQYYKILGSKLKRIFYSTAKIEKVGDKEHIVVVSFLPIYGSFEYFLGFWLYVTKFDSETGDLVFEGLDTLSKHTMTMAPGGPGPVFELNNLYYNFSLYKRDTMLLKVFDLEGNFVSEKRIILNNLPPDGYFWEAYFLKKEDSSFVFALTSIAPWFLANHRSYLLKISKDFTFEWLKPIKVNEDSLAILSLLERKDGKILALCTTVDTTRYFVEIESDGSVSYVKQLKLDKRIYPRVFKQISDGGYILLGKLRLYPINKPDTSIGVLAKFSKDYEIEQEFYHKREPMDWGHLFSGVYELSDHSFLVEGYYHYFPYLLKLKDVLVSVDKQEKGEPIFAQQIVEDYIYLDEPSLEEVSIYSLEGIKVLESNGLCIINVKHLPSGVYFLKRGTKFYKFIKL